MSSAISMQILKDIAQDLSGKEISFPTFLDITLKVRNALKDPNLSVDQLSKLVMADPLLSTKIIRIANSAALNPYGREVGDVKTAISRVGMETVRTVSFSVAIEQLTQSRPMIPLSYLTKSLWDHSAHVAALGRVLARKFTTVNPDQALFAGLVHDLGVFYLLSRAANFPELVNDKAELHALLVDWHENIGHALLDAMEQPEAILEAVREHDVDRPLERITNLNDILYVANKIANTLTGWRDQALGGQAVDTSVLSSLFSEEKLQALIAESEEEVQSLKASLAGG